MMVERAVNPLLSPSHGGIEKRIGDTPKTPAGRILHLFFRAVIARNPSDTGRMTRQSHLS